MKAERGFDSKQAQCKRGARALQAGSPLVPPNASSVTSRALTTRAADFWLLGGLSILVWMMMSLSTGHRMEYGVNNHFQNLAATSASLAIFVNYPHFLASYRLAYTRGWGFIRRHWAQTLLVPCLLIQVLAYAFFAASGWVSGSSGPAVLGALVNVMFFTVGWHYTKQTFGVMMVYASYDRYPLQRWQREAVRYSLLALWWYSYAYSFQRPAEQQFWELRYQAWTLPPGSLLVTGVVLLCLVATVIYGVVVRNWQAGHRPGLNFIVPYLAMFVWWAPGLRQPEFYSFVVPFFHSLQYLVFVYRMEQYGLNQDEPSDWHLSAVALVLVACGWMAFEYLPGNLDSMLHNRDTLGLSFFLIAANLFLNIHHYFLDNVLWRVREDEVVRRALLG